MPKSTGRAVSRMVAGGTLVVSAALLGGCNTTTVRQTAAVEPIERVVGPHDKVTPGGGRYQVGKPYSVGGRTYVPREDPGYDAVGIASWYGGDFHHGTRTANGEVFDRHTLSAAHPTMPLPSYARVTSVATGKSIVVRVNDRGPYAAGRIIDISEKTAHMLDIKSRGVSQVRVQYIGRAGLGGSDQRVLAATLRGPGVMPQADERTLLAQADLGIGPRRTVAPGATLVASAAPVQAPEAEVETVPAAAPAAARPQQVAAAAPMLPPAAGAIRPSQTGAARAFAASDAYAFELAGVDATALRAALKTKAPAKPVAKTSAEVLEAELPPASGAPMSLVPAPGSAGYTTSALPSTGAARAGYAPEGAAGRANVFARIADGDRLAALAE